MSENCKWLHTQLNELPIIQYQFDENCLPLNGIYFFYEKGEYWGHGRKKQRIVRIGTANNCNFGKRIKEHYLLDNSKMNFNKNNPKPSDRSIFRKNIGKAILSKNNDSYSNIWEIDFIKKKNREEHNNRRNIEKERKLELDITKIIRDNFSFRFIIIDNQIIRKNCKGLEGLFIGTIAQCNLCKPSKNWLGKDSPKNKIVNSGLWQVQCLNEIGIDDNSKSDILYAIDNTINWLKNMKCF
ncbi:MAG: hypothetical protein J7K40_07470 [candidate division Zixibacteria bacterium]|nr:hypothetical protein [candidate division Zixibacteria bacterium]